MKGKQIEPWNFTRRSHYVTLPKTYSWHYINDFIGFLKECPARSQQGSRMISSSSSFRVNSAQQPSRTRLRAGSPIIKSMVSGAELGTIPGAAVQHHKGFKKLQRCGLKRLDCIAGLQDCRNRSFFIETFLLRPPRKDATRVRAAAMICGSSSASSRAHWQVCHFYAIIGHLYVIHYDIIWHLIIYHWPWLWLSSRWPIPFSSSLALRAHASFRSDRMGTSA